MRVFVPFGKRRITGYVVNLTSSWDKKFQLKSINDLLDTKPVVDKEILALTKWLSGLLPMFLGRSDSCGPARRIR